ncbi:hypothetical protein, variant [Phytophthora nicotianae INRA-310]|uniref:Uncharacterized protein n=1 Tax=Phytophthora nicotianae (strain INRA-310) TaxID=761204 RepID=W2PG11_PHYN3|nr:hypothetical protein, variant [Phytophthora nicotianae INRA-310]ETM99972.1 hypothetical protein, variant [Phytophthora nicotianae INRA-310]
MSVVGIKVAGESVADGVVVTLGTSVGRSGNSVAGDSVAVGVDVADGVVVAVGTRVGRSGKSVAGDGAVVPDGAVVGAVVSKSVTGSSGDVADGVVVVDGAVVGADVSKSVMGSSTDGAVVVDGAVVSVEGAVVGAGLTDLGGEEGLAIDIGAVNGHLEVAKYLRARAASPSDSLQRAQVGFKQVRQLQEISRECGGVLDAAAIRGRTIALAVSNGHLDVVTWLVAEYGADSDTNLFDYEESLTSSEIFAMDGAAMEKWTLGCGEVFT